MAYSKRRQNIVFYLVMTTLAIILFFAYKVQYSMQESLTHFDNYEIFDCGLFHSSLPSMQKELDMIRYQEAVDDDNGLNLLANELDEKKVN